jgi:hypothetical protein
MQNFQNKGAANQREFMRIETTLHMKIRLVRPEEIPSLENRLVDYVILSSKPASPNDSSFDEWMHYFDAKLDLILQLLSHNQKIDDMSLQSCTISAGGIDFTLSESDQFLPKDILEIKIMYPSYMPQILSLYGEVLRSEKKDNGYHTAAKFIFMNDYLTDTLAKLILEKEREMIRRERGK